jgi:hypothetical protein
LNDLRNCDRMMTAKLNKLLALLNNYNYKLHCDQYVWIIQIYIEAITLKRDPKKELTARVTHC